MMPECSLAAPEIPTLDDTTKERQFSWVRGNRSTYLMDFGLWTACRESRAAIEQLFKVDERIMVSEEEEDYISEGSNENTFPGIPDIAGFRLEGEWQYCFTYPKMDLFLLRPLDPRTLEWKSVLGFPFYNRTESLMNDAVHIALDFQLIGGVWDTPRAKCAMKALHGGLYSPDRVWFVDHSLRRRVGISPARNRHQFHGIGCIFTEVRNGDMGWYHSWNFGEDKGEAKGVSVDGFLRDLEDRVTEVLDSGELVPPEFPHLNHHYLFNSRTVGILAYEEYSA